MNININENEIIDGFMRILVRASVEYLENNFSSDYDSKGDVLNMIFSAHISSLFTIVKTILDNDDEERETFNKFHDDFLKAIESIGTTIVKIKKYETS